MVRIMPCSHPFKRRSKTVQRRSKLFSAKWSATNCLQSLKKNRENLCSQSFSKKQKIKYLWSDSHNPKTLFFYMDSTEGKWFSDIYKCPFLYPVYSLYFELFLMILTENPKHCITKCSLMKYANKY